VVKATELEPNGKVFLVHRPSIHPSILLSILVVGSLWPIVGWLVPRLVGSLVLRGSLGSILVSTFKILK